MNSEAEMQTTMPGPGRPIPYDACDNCQYWKRSFKTGANGICRKNPPVVGTDPSGDRWPSSRAGDWCGEYQRRVTSGRHSNGGIGGGDPPLR